MKTAMQELIESIAVELYNRGMFLNWDMYLEKERQQIINAHNKANENWEKGYPTPITDGEVYFNQTYTQK